MLNLNSVCPKITRKHKKNFVIEKSLLEIVDKYGVPLSQWDWMRQALFEVSMNKKALWINVCADDWTAEMSTIASNELQ